MPDRDHQKYWGVFGGLFDPVHLGHLRLAQEIVAKASLKGVMLTLSAVPPHRTETAVVSFEHRLAMLMLAVEEYDKLAVSDIERRLSAPSYTVQTLQALKKRFPDRSFCFIIGADNLKTFTTWHLWQEILEISHLLVGVRPGAKLEIPKELPPDRVRVFDTPPIDISSTVVRQRIQDGAQASELAELVPSRVVEYIMRHRLYH